MVRVNDATSVHLTLIVEAGASDELLVKHDEDLVIRVADHGAAKTERHILSLS